MPTYEYECSGCGHRFEEFQSITEASLRKCPECGALKLRRLIGSGGAILFKGSGFYTTDYRSKEYEQKASSEKPSSGPQGEPSEEKSSHDEKAEKPDES